MDLPCLCPSLRAHPPKSARPINMSAIRNKQNLCAIARPRRMNLRVIFRVVIPRQRALRLLRQPHHTRFAFYKAIARIHHKNMKSPVILRRNKHNPLAIGRPSRLHIHRSTLRDLLRDTRRQIQQPQFHRIMLIRNINNTLPIRRPIRLIVVSHPVCNLLR